MKVKGGKVNDLFSSLWFLIGIKGSAHKKTVVSY